MALDPITIVELQLNLNKVKDDHAQLENEIQDFLMNPNKNDIKIYRLKKEKLILKDKIAKIEGLLTPNIIA